MKFIGQNIYDFISKFRNDVYLTNNSSLYSGEDGLGDINVYARNVNILNDQADSGSDTTSGDPKFRVGSSTTECFQLTANYATNTKNMQIAVFKTLTDSGTANDGRFRFSPDNVNVLEIDDGGIDFYSGFAGGISFNGTDVLTDNGSGTTTLANIDALDATTISTISSAVSSGIDHDSLTNFVAAEHVNWASASAGTIHSTNIPTLNQNTTGSSASCTGNAATATKLATQRDLQCDLGETGADGFDGSANATAIGVTGTLGVGNGGTGLTSISTLLNSNTTKSDVGLGNVENKSASTIIGEIVAGDIPTLNQNTTGSAATLTASTSNALGIGSIELGHADDTTLSRSASGTLAVEGKNVRTEDKHLFIKQGSFAIDPGTARIYFPMTGTAENTSAVGVAQPFLAPANGKLLKIHFRSNKDHSAFNQTFHLVNWDDNEQFTGGALSDVGAKTVTGVDNNNVITVDFQSSLDSGTNEFTAGELIAISVTNATNLSGNTKYIFTAVFEFDFSSY